MELNVDSNSDIAPVNEVDQVVVEQEVEEVEEEIYDNDSTVTEHIVDTSLNLLKDSKPLERLRQVLGENQYFELHQPNFFNSSLFTNTVADIRTGSDESLLSVSFVPNHSVRQGNVKIWYPGNSVFTSDGNVLIILSETNDRGLAVKSGDIPVGSIQFSGYSSPKITALNPKGKIAFRVISALIEEDGGILHRFINRSGREVGRLAEMEQVNKCGLCRLNFYSAMDIRTKALVLSVAHNIVTNT